MLITLFPFLGAHNEPGGSLGQRSQSSQGTLYLVIIFSTPFRLRGVNNNPYCFQLRDELSIPEGFLYADHSFVNIPYIKLPTN